MSELLLTTSLLQPAKLYPNKPALICGETSYSYGQFFERVQRLANGLAGLGLAKGNRVATLMLNCHRYLELYYAIPPQSRRMEADGIRRQEILGRRGGPRTMPSGSWGGRRPSRGAYVTGRGATRGRPVPEGVNVATLWRRSSP